MTVEFNNSNVKKKKEVENQKEKSLIIKKL